ncbi:MAG: prolyl oligopeptidase family serine peptidase [Bacteroidota bacterium]
MTPDVYSEWNRIRNVKITDDGNWAMYQLTREIGDKVLKIYDTRQDKTYTFPRVKKASFDQKGGFAFFMLEHSYEARRDLERKKTKKKDMPRDTLCIYHLKDRILTKIPNVKSYKNPSDWGGFVAYQMEPDVERDTIKTPIKESKETGTKLIVKNLDTSVSDTLYYVKEYEFAKKGKGLVATSNGADNVLEQGVYVYDFELSDWASILEEKGDVSNLSWNEKATQLAFILDRDTTENRIRPYELYSWKKDEKKAIRIADQNSTFLPTDYNISTFTNPKYSKDGERLIFYITPPPILQDTSLLEDEIVDVEVWHYNDSELYTRQENNLKEDQKRDFACVYFMGNKQFEVIGKPAFDNVIFDKEYTTSYVIAIHDESYNKERMWMGFGQFDGYRIEIESGETKQFIEKARGRARVSPEGRYCYWYDAGIQGHWAYNIRTDQLNQITSKQIGRFADEKNDRPMDPTSYGFHEFTMDEEFLIVYDRYDIWLIDPDVNVEPRKVTYGRGQKIVYRVVDTDRENETTDISKPLLLHVFNEVDKSEAYATLDVESGKIKELYQGDVRLDKTPIKARKSNKYITTVENYSIFPNLVLTDATFSNMHTFTDANPQQQDYLWGEIKLHSWTSETGQILNGLLVLPENFDPNEKHPMLVNFYERSSDGLHRHRAPYAHRSTINYSYYSSKGYIIFNPDVVYRIGYPGQSCYESVIPGVQSLIAEGYIDEDRIAVQGHSWGGYQIADLLTKTDLFRCAEAGAPVVNMVSAYGGIRWGSGLSRMFQYEKTQSRLGATLWERPDLYLENSPIFKLDKMTTPVLILHNDKDGAVPWYQGIEYFNALRRLNKPAWFLNYNDEPHWPVKWQNRLDFNIRMEQFFDHYLMDTPMPRWMKNGVPAIQKGIDQGLDHRN